MGVLVDEAAIARTYSHPSVADPYEIVQQYREAMQYGADASPTAVARKLEAPRGRVRPWLEDGSKPDSVTAIEVAEELGWLADEWTPVTRALSTLVAGIFAAGSIAESNWRPSWTPDSDVARQEIEAALATVGTGVAEAHLDAPGRADEVRPADHASALARVLAGAGAPVGEKSPETVRSLPAYLDAAPPSVRAAWLELYVRERGFGDDRKVTKQITVDRHPGFYGDLVDLIRDVTGESVTRSERGIVIPAAAIQTLGIGEG